MANVGNLVVDMSLDSSKFSAALKKAESEAMSSANKMEGTFSKLGTAVAGGLVVATTAAVAAGGASVKMAADQEAAFMRVNKIMDITVDKQDQFKQSIRDLSNKYGQATEDIAKGSATLAATGRYKNVEDLVKGTETLIKASTAWGMGAETTANYLSQIAAGYNMTTDQVERYSSSVAELADKSGASEEQLIRGNIAMMGLRKEFGMGIDDVNGMTAAFAEMGVQPENMETAFRSMFTVFTSGSKPALAAMGELGVSTEDYNRAIREGKLPQFFASVAKKLETVTDEYKRASLAGDLFGTYGRNMANKLPDALGKVAEYTAISSKAFQENVRTTQEAEKQLNTFWGQYDRVMSGIKNTMAGMGDNMLAPLTGGLREVADLLALTSKGDWGAAWAKLSASIASIDWKGMLDNASAAMTGLISDMQNMDWSKLATGALDAISDLGRQVANAMGRINWSSAANTAISALAGAFRTAINVSLDVGSWIANKLRGIDSSSVRAFGQQIGQALVSAIQTSITEVGKLFADLPGMVSKGFSNLKSIASDLARLGGELASGLSDAIIPALAGIGAKVLDTVTGILASGINALGVAMEGPINAVIDAINAALRTVTAVVAKANEYSGGRIPKIDLGQLENVTVNPSATGTNFSGGLGGGGAGPGGANAWIDKMVAQNKGWAEIQELAPKDYGLKRALTAAELAYAKEAWAKKQGVAIPGAAATGGGSVNQTLLNALMTGNYSALTGGGAGSVGSWASGLLGNAGIPSYSSMLPYSQSGMSNFGSAIGQSAWGGGVVPVFVTNMGAGGMGTGTGTGGFNNYPAGVSGKYAPGPGQFWNTAGGTGLVSTVNDADFDVDTCKIDASGMSPGVMENLIANGVWKPLFGSTSSEALKSTFNYTGDYSGYTPGAAGYSGVGTAAIGGLRNLGGSGSVSTLPGGAQSMTQWQNGVKNSTNLQVRTTQKTTQMDTQATQRNIGAWNNMYSQLATMEQKNTFDTINSWNDAALAYNYASLTTCGTWDEANSRWSTDATLVAQQQQLAAQAQADAGKMLKDAYGGHIANSTVAIGKNLADWSAQSAKHNASMAQFDKSIDKFQGTLTGYSVGLGGGITSGTNLDAAIIQALGSNASPEAKAAFKQAALTGMTQIQAWQAAGGANLFGSKGSGSAGSWVGYGSTAGNSVFSGASTGWGGYQASSSLASGGTSGPGWSVVNGTVKIGSYAEGGIVQRPTLALIGEAGEKEAVIPLSKAAQMGFGGPGGSPLSVNSTIYLDGRKLADAVGSTMTNRLRNNAGLKVR